MTVHYPAHIRPVSGDNPSEPTQAQVIDRTVLELLAAAEHGMTRAQLASRLYPRQAQPYRTAIERQVELRARKTHQAKARKLTRYALDRLSRRGHIETAPRYLLAPETARALEAHGLHAVKDRAYIESEGDIVGVALDQPEPADTHAARILSVLLEHPEGLPPMDLKRASGGLTASGGESGAWRRALRGWEQSGDVVSAGLRRITQEGLKALGRHRV